MSVTLSTDEGRVYKPAGRNSPKAYTPSNMKMASRAQMVPITARETRRVIWRSFR